MWCKNFKRIMGGKGKIKSVGKKRRVRFMKKRRGSSLLFFALFLCVFMFGVSVAQAEDDGFTAMFEIGPSVLFRLGNDDIPLVNDTAGIELLNADDVNLGIAPGLEARLGGRYRMFGAEVRYIGMHEWSQSDDAFSANGAWVQYLIPVGNGLPALVDVDYDSYLHNIEFNLRWWPFDRLSVLAGFRYLMINEELTIEDNVGPGLNMAIFEHKTDNTLLGGQVGVEGVIVSFNNVLFEGDAINLGGSVKVGYFNNQIKTDISITQSVVPGTGVFADDSDDQGTFLVEGGATIGYNITPNIAVQLRYQLMWIENVALAPEQVPASEPWASGMVSTETEGVFYHGPWLGINVSF
jgi:hypothetical protein